MLKHLVIAVALFAAVGCGRGADDQNDDKLQASQEFLDSTPEADAFDSEVTGDADSEGLSSTGSGLTAGDEYGSTGSKITTPPEYLARAREAVKGLNQAMHAILAHVKAITQTPPTTVTADTHVWGPVDRGDITFKFTMKKAADKKFGWKLEGKPKAAADDQYAVLLAGRIIRNEVAHRGRGSVGVDGDAIAKLDPSLKSTGKLLFGFFHGAAGAKAISYALKDFSPNTDVYQKVSALFHAIRGPAGGTIVRMASYANIQDSATAAKELVVARVRWLPTVGGRVDGFVTAGDVPANHAYVVDGCWNAQLAEGYYRIRDWDKTSQTFVKTLREVGQASACDAKLPSKPPPEDPNAAPNDTDENVETEPAPAAMPDGSGS